MAKVKKKMTSRHIDLNIQSMWEVIDNYLPASYTQDVIKKIPTVSAASIRMTKSNRKGKLIIIKALFDLSMETKELLNQ